MQFASSCSRRDVVASSTDSNDYASIRRVAALKMILDRLDFSDRESYVRLRSANRFLRREVDARVLHSVESKSLKDLRREKDWRTRLLRVTKRDGRVQLASVGKIVTRLERLAGHELAVDCLDLGRRVMDALTHGMPTAQLDEIAAREASALGLREPDYLLLAARISVSNLHKETSPKVVDVVRSMLAGDVSRRKPRTLIDESCADFMLTFAERLQALLKFERDYMFSYFGIKTLVRSLTTAGDRILERPQHLFLREAVGINKDRILNWRASKTSRPEESDALAEEILASIQETYEATSNFLYTHASPTKFNAATPLGQLASCFLLTPADDGDSIEGIFELVKRCAKISQSAGGIGFSVSSIRAANSYICGTNGLSRGIMPFLRVFNETARAVDQGGAKRPGAFAAYAEPWHLDIEAFLRMKRIQKTGGSGASDVRCFELFQALWIPDLFFKRVVSNGPWCLFTPNETPELVKTWGEEFENHYADYERQVLDWQKVNAQELERNVPKEKRTPSPFTFKFVEGGARALLEAISLTIIETGTPYLLAKDACNRKSNQQNLGTIRSSNLCVAGHTRVLTDRGQLPIESLKDQRVNVWNGEEWSPVTVRQTGAGVDLLKITFSNGTELECTPEHNFALQDRPDEKVAAKDLKIGDKLVRLQLPAAFELQPTTPFPHPYTHGFFCGDGTYRGGKPDVTIYSEKKRCVVPFLALRVATPREYKPDESAVVQLHCRLVEEIREKYAVPSDQSIDTRIRWFEGLADADGTVCKCGPNSESLQIASIHLEFLRTVRLMLQTLGVHSVVGVAKPAGVGMLPGRMGSGTYADRPRMEYATKELHRLQVPVSGLQALKELGFAPKRLKFSMHETSPSNGLRFAKVIRIEEGTPDSDTYCFTESKRGMGVFEGVLTLQCSEIIEYSSPEETAVCNLASISLPAYVKNAYTDKATFDYGKLHEVARLVTRNLNLVVDSTSYPIESARRSNLRHRPIGIGVQGLADVFYMMRLPYLSEEAAEINRRVFETVYHGAMLESIELARKFGKTYESYPGSPLSQGKLQFDLWNKPEPTGLWDWGEVRAKLARHGAYNSLLLAPMPTASTSNILGNVESFEPGHNVYARRVDETFAVVNKHLVRELRALDLWYPKILDDILAEDGSLQNIDSIPPRFKEIYRTVWELKLLPQIEMAKDRAIFICQSQSFNWHVADPTPEMIQKAILYAWKVGLKTIMYYCRLKPKTNAVQIANVRRPTAAVPTVAAAASPIPRALAEPEVANPAPVVEEEQVCRREAGCVSCGS